MSDIAVRDRVTHRNAVFGHGDGTVLKVEPAKMKGRAPTHAWVRFDRIGNARPDGVRVELSNLTRIASPAPAPNGGGATFCWPPERAGQPVDMTPGAA